MAGRRNRSFGVHQARPGDMAAVLALAKVAGVDLEDEISVAVRTTGVAGAALRADLTGGAQGFQRHIVEQFQTHRDSDQRVPFLHEGASLLNDM